MASFLTKFLRPGGIGAGWPKKLGKTLEFPKANDEYNTGADYLSYGRTITDSALKSMDAEYADYQQRLAEGLPADVRQSYASARGAVTDEQTRSNNAFRANLTQRARAGGGQISDQAAVDASIDNNAQTEDAAFQARNQIYASEANASLDNTNKLLDAIANLNATKAGVGLGQEGIGSSIYQNALRIMLERRKAVGSTLASFAAFGGG